MDLENPFVEPHAAHEFVGETGFGNTRHQHVIHLRDGVPRVRQPLGQIAIVGDDQQSLTILIQTTDAEQPPVMVRKQLDHALAALRIGVGAQIPAGLVQQEVGPSSRLELLAIEPDIVLVRVDLERAGSVIVSRSTETRPAAMYASQLRRASTPAMAR